MGLIEGLVVLAIFMGFAYIIFAKMHQNNPMLMGKIKDWFKDKPSIHTPESLDRIQQVYDERRTMM